MELKNRALKAGAGTLFIDRENMKAFLPRTDENGDVQFDEVNPNEYAGYKQQTLLAKDKDTLDKYQAKYGKKTVLFLKDKDKVFFGLQLSFKYSKEKKDSKWF